MTLTGKLIKDAHPLSMTTVRYESEDGRFHKTLEEAFRLVCKDLGIPLPLWLKKNTKEFARFHRTFFSPDQFLEPTLFDRFELTLEEM
jgi:hypothetical protein